MQRKAEEMSGSYVQPLHLFEGLDIRGAVVHLGDAWQQACRHGRDYQPTVAQLLGETAAVTALIAGTAQAARPPDPAVARQWRPDPVAGHGLQRTMLQMRGMARSNPVVLAAPVPELLGAHQGGQLHDEPRSCRTARQPYQSYRAHGRRKHRRRSLSITSNNPNNNRRACLLRPARSAAACLFLQKLPEADHHDQDGWQRITQLAATVKPAELLELDTASLLTAASSTKTSRRTRHPPLRPAARWPTTARRTGNKVRRHDPQSWAMPMPKTILAEHGEIVIRDDICNRDYRLQRRTMSPRCLLHQRRARLCIEPCQTDSFRPRTDRVELLYRNVLLGQVVSVVNIDVPRLAGLVLFRHSGQFSLLRLVAGRHCDRRPASPFQPGHQLPSHRPGTTLERNAQAAFWRQRALVERNAGPVSSGPAERSCCSCRQGNTHLQAADRLW